MKGLLVKDGYTVLKQMGIFIVIILVFQFINDEIFSNIALLYGALLPVTALAYDERSKWDKLSIMMPYTTNQLVVSKYLLGYFTIALFTLISVAIKFVKNIGDLSNVFGSLLLGYLVTMCIATLFQAVNLPFMFKFGVEKGRFVMFIFIGCVAFVGTMLQEIVFDLFNQSFNFSFVVVTVVFTIVINVLSIMLSKFLYRTKTK